MVDYKVIANQIDEALRILSKSISESQSNDIRSYIRAGEFGLAIDTLCDLLYEDEIPVPQKAYNLLQDSGNSIGIEKSTWEVLQGQIFDVQA